MKLSERAFRSSQGRALRRMPGKHIPAVGPASAPAPFLLGCGSCTSVCEMKKYMMKHSLFLALVWCAALVLCASCVVRHVRGTNGNLGVWLTDGLAAGLLVYAIWHEPIHRFCSHGVGRVLAILFGCGMAVFVCLLAFVVVSGYSDQPKGEKKAVIVLGAGLRGERITSLLKCRLDAAYAYWMDHRRARPR